MHYIFLKSYGDYFDRYCDCDTSRSQGMIIFASQKHEDLTFTGVCSKQTCFHTSREQNLTPLQRDSSSFYGCFDSYFTLMIKTRCAASRDLTFALTHVAISIIFQSIARPYLTAENFIAQHSLAPLFHIPILFNPPLHAKAKYASKAAESSDL